MLVLAPVPVDVMPTAPPSASPSSPGQEGLFAAHLKSATEHRTTGTWQTGSPVQQADLPLPPGEQQVLTDTTAAAGNEQQAPLSENKNKGITVETELLNTVAQGTIGAAQPFPSVTAVAVASEQRPALTEIKNKAKTVEAELLDTVALATNEVAQPFLSVATNLALPLENITENRSAVTNSSVEAVHRSNFIYSEANTAQVNTSGKGVALQEPTYPSPEASLPPEGLDRGIIFPASFQERAQDNGTQSLTKGDILPVLQGQANEPIVSEVAFLAQSQAAPVNSNESALTRMLQALTSPLPATVSDGVTPQARTATTTAEVAGKTDVSPTTYSVAAQQATAPSTPLQENSDTGFAHGQANTSAPLAVNPSSSLTVPLTNESRTAATVFSTTDLKQAVDPTLQATAMTGTAVTESPGKQNGPLIVNNQYGQIITIQQAGDPEEESIGAGSTAKTGPAVSESKSLDITNQYIHSHLPNETPQKGPEQGSEQQLSSSSKNQQPEVIKAIDPGSEGQFPNEPLPLLKGQPGVGQENQPFLFAHQRGITPMSTGGAAVESSPYRLPSGINVPEGTVVDQMIAHFSINKRLESGTVNLRLYPQELGELRMEIRVEQDNIKAHIVAQSPQAQEMIDRHLPRLRESLEQQGLHLQQIDVTIAANDNASNERYPGSSGWQQAGHPAGPKAQATVFSLENDNEASEDRSVANTLSVVA